MAETPHDPTSSSCPCRACSLNRRRLGTSSPPLEQIVAEHRAEPGLAPAGDAASPPDLAASRPEPAPLLRIGYATVDKRDVDALVKAYRRARKAERTAVAARQRAVIALSDLGLSVRAIAERVDLDPQTVHRWTRGEP